MKEEREAQRGKTGRKLYPSGGTALRLQTAWSFGECPDDQRSRTVRNVGWNDRQQIDKMKELKAGFGRHSD